MLNRVGIIPAAGKAERFGGVLKELLPIEPCRTALRRQADNLDYICDCVVVVTNLDKIVDHARALGKYAGFYIQNEIPEIHGAIFTAIEAVNAQSYFFAMPDTIIPPIYNEEIPHGDFVLGVFDTDKPERFGMLRDGKIVNKKKGEPGKAWGVMQFSSDVALFWERTRGDMDYTQMMNAAMQRFGFQTFPLSYYYDLASFEDYKDYLCQK